MALFSVLFGRKGASIGGISIDASVHEDHVSPCEVTENPVEEGAEITDHVQLKPKELTIQGVVTDSPLGIAIIGNIQNVARSVAKLFGVAGRSIDAYNKLLELQESREPFTVVTGLKKYDNMILLKLSVPREASKGNAIHFTAEMKQIRIVSSKTIENPPRSPSVSDRASKTVDKGGQVTPATEEDDPLSDNPDQKPKSRGPSILHTITHPGDPTVQE